MWVTIDCKQCILSQWEFSILPNGNKEITMMTFLCLWRKPLIITVAFSQFPLLWHLPQIITDINSSLPEQDGHLFADDIFRCIFDDEIFCILIKISLRFVPKGTNVNIPALVQIMAWRRIGDKPLSEPMLTQFTDAYVRHQGRWVKTLTLEQNGWHSQIQFLESKILIFCLKFYWILFRW